MSTLHPCQRCGACCASFRVSFPAAELDTVWGQVPAELTVPVPPFRVAMRGSDEAPWRCVALRGQVGEQTACAIYTLRASTCRDFGASWEHGVPEPACDRARARHGLGPLTPEDWTVAQVGDTARAEVDRGRRRRPGA